MKNRYLIATVLASIIVALDQLTKVLVLSRFRLGESVTVIENFFNLTFVKNYGAAFGFLSQSHPEFREIFFLTMPPVAMIVIGTLLKKAPADDKMQIYALSSILGGALGNYIDRLRFRYVVDFLDFHWFNKYSWPAFNIADSAIVIGVGVLMYQMYLEGKKQKANQST
ncbi:MAG: signal peptidase II [Bdellovibrionales bacterium]